MTSANYIPVVDFSPLSEKNERVPSEKDWAETQERIYNALSEVGFVYLINHGVDMEKVQRSFTRSKAFFELPTEIKLKYKKDYTSTGSSHHGYVEPNQEKLSPSSSYEFRESFDFILNPGTQQTKRDVLETTISKFEETLTELKDACKPLIKNILTLFATALDEDRDYFWNLSKNIEDIKVPSYTTFRTLYYPKVPADLEIKPGYVRCAEHTDYGILTLLFQDEIGGLEVKTVHGTWTPATPIPDSILVNTGDLLEFWSGGRFPATPHRVLIPEIEFRRQIPRQSIAYFVHPDDESIVAPLKSSTNSNFQPVSAYEHAKKKLDASYSY